VLASNHHSGLAAVAAGTGEPLAAIENRHLGAVPISHLGGIRLDLMATFAAVHD